LIIQEDFDVKNIRSIELAFENCEYVILPVYTIGICYAGEVHSEISRIASNAVISSDFVDEVALEIFPEAEDLTIFERILAFDDVTNLVIEYNDGTSQELSVLYDSDTDALGAPNNNQHSYKSSLNVLYLLISRNKNVHDYFSKYDIEDSETVNFRKDMYDIGRGRGYDFDIDDDDDVCEMCDSEKAE
jgi:hypothetical protein